MIVSGDIHTGGAIDDGTWSDLPEMNVPTTNMRQCHCTSPTCGSWSVGLYDPDGSDGLECNRSGFGMVDIEEGENGLEATFRIYQEDGSLRFEASFPEEN